MLRKARIIILAAMASSLVGCTAGYSVAEVTDKFSDPSKPTTKAMVGNHIEFHDPLGSDNSALNGWVSRDRQSGKVMAVGFYLHNVRPAAMVSWTGGTKWLRIRPGNELIVLADGQRIVARAVAGSMDHRVQAIQGSIYTDYIDDATYEVAPSQFAAVAHATALELKIEGADGSDAYPRSMSILSSFGANLRRFYDEEIAPYIVANNDASATTTH